MLGMEQNNYGFFLSNTLKVCPLNLTDAERGTLKFGYKTAENGYTALPYTLNNDGSATLDMAGVPYGSYRLLAEYRPSGSEGMQTLESGWTLRNLTYLDAENVVTVAVFEPKTEQGVTTITVRYENGTPSADVKMRIYKAEGMVSGKEMSLSLVDEINIGKNPYTINSKTLGLGGGDYVFYFTTTDGTFLGSQLAHISAAQYTVKFLGLYGKLLKSQTVDAGGSAELPAAPAEDGYDFKGWKNLTTGRMVTEVTNVTADMTIQAVYEAKQATVTLFLDGGRFEYGGQTEYSLPLGDRFTQLGSLNPTRDGYKFLGWYRDIACTNKVEGDFTVTQNVVLYAKWESRYAIDSSALADNGAISSFNLFRVISSGGNTSYDSGVRYDGASQGQEISAEFRLYSGTQCTGVTCIGQTSGISYPVTLTENSSGYQAVFSMPDEAVTLALTTQSAWEGSITVSLNSSGYDSIYYLAISGGSPWQSREQYPYTASAEFNNLPDGTYYITGTTSEGRSFSGQAQIENGANETVWITLDEVYSVSGTLTSDTGTLPSGLTAYLTGDNWWNYFSSPVDADGSISFSNVPSGSYTLSVSGRHDYPLSKKEFQVSAANPNLGEIQLTCGRDVTAKIVCEEGLGAKYARVSLEKSTDSGCYYLWSDVCPCGETVKIEDIITDPGTYRLRVTDLSKTYYGGYIRFDSKAQEFEVTADDDGRLPGIPEQTLSCSAPAAQIGDLSGSVTLDRTEAYAGELVDLAIRWESVNAAAPTFTITLPDGVEFAKDYYETTKTLTAEAGTRGTLHATLCVTNNASGTLSIPVKAAVNESEGVFGTAVISVEEITLTAPAQVRGSESFTVYGEAAEDSLIALRDTNGKTLAVAKTVGRSFSAELKLTTDTVLYAESLLEDGTILSRSAPVSVAVIQDEPIAVSGVRYGSDDANVSYNASYNKKLNTYAFWQWVDMQMMGFELPVHVSFSGSGSISAVKFRFCGVKVSAEQQESGVWTATFGYGEWGGAGVKQLTALVTTVDGKTLEIPVAEVNLLIDPSGVVTDENGKPLAGVTVYCQVLKGNQWVNFDAESYGQVNPQITDENGRYGWMVPEGKYRILAVKEGYQSYDSLKDAKFSNSDGNTTITIPPVRTDIDFRMKLDNSKVYTIFPTAVENATVRCEQSSSAAGKSVTLTVSADAGYAVKKVHVTGVDSNKSYDVRDTGNGSYSFTMPAERVSFSAELMDAPTAVSVTVDGKITVTGLKAAQSVKVIAAFYDTDGRMIALTMPKLTGNGTEATAAVQTQSGAVLRVFLLDSATNKPLAECAKG